MRDRTEMLRTEILELVSSILSATGRNSEIATEASLADAGMTSLDMVSLMLGLEAKYGVMIPSNELTPRNFYSIASVADLMLRTIGEVPEQKVA